MPDQRRLPTDNDVTGVTCHWGLWLGLRNDSRAGHDRDDRERQHKFSNHEFSLWDLAGFPFLVSRSNGNSDWDFSGTGILLRFFSSAHREFAKFHGLGGRSRRVRNFLQTLAKRHTDVTGKVDCRVHFPPKRVWGGSGSAAHGRLHRGRSRSLLENGPQAPQKPRQNCNRRSPNHKRNLHHPPRRRSYSPQ